MNHVNTYFGYHILHLIYFTIYDLYSLYIYIHICINKLTHTITYHTYRTTPSHTMRYNKVAHIFCTIHKYASCSNTFLWTGGYYSYSRQLVPNAARCHYKYNIFKPSFFQILSKSLLLSYCFRTLSFQNTFPKILPQA